jgi:hypothetical protein
VADQAYTLVAFNAVGEGLDHLPDVSNTPSGFDSALKRLENTRAHHRLRIILLTTSGIYC